MKKFLLIVLVVFLVIIIAGVIICSLNKEKLANYAVEKSMEVAKIKVMENLPEGVSADSAGMLMDRVVEKIKSGEIDKTQMQYLVSNIQTSFSDSELDSAETVKLLETIQKMLAPVEEAAEPVAEEVAEPVAEEAPAE